MHSIALALLAVGSALPMPQDRDPVSLYLAEWRRMPIGAGTLEDLAHPPAFLARAADRRIREQVRAQIHAVHPGAGREPFEGLPRIAPDAEVLPSPRTVPTDAAAIAWAQSLADEAMPARRGFRPPLDWLATATPASPALAGSDAIARLVASRLARDGLIATALRAIEQVRRDAPDAAADPASLRAVLDDAGLPTDLLARFAWPDAPSASADATIARLAAAAVVPAEATKLVRSARLAWAPTLPGFDPFPDDGSVAPDLLRAQATRGNDWAGPGDGASVDIVRQLAAARVASTILVGIESAFASGFAHRLAERDADGADVALLAQPLVLSQWAQDAARLGRATGPDGRLEPAALLPRWASRGEAVSSLVSGDTLGGAALTTAGLRVARSPLLFQGGNLLVAIDPADGTRLLLVGEAEVRRNVALGLTAEQAREALRLEFGAARLVELATPSFHVDLDVSVRRVGTRLVAFVNDGDDAMARVLVAGIGAFERAGRLGAAAAEAARGAVAASDDAALAAAIGPALTPTNGPVLTLDLAAAFTGTTLDRGVANLQRFLAALDRFRAIHAPQRALPNDPGFRGYLDAIRRGRALERELPARLKAAGLEVVPVPGLADGDRGVSPVNMLQLPTLVLLSATGDLYEQIDIAQSEAVSAVVGAAVVVRAVVTDETQRRSGGLHCAVQGGWSGKMP